MNIVGSWYSRKKWLWLLYPISLLYRFIIFVRFWLYRLAIFKHTKLPVTVIVVGNISVGGTGKTPLVMALDQFFKSKGLTPGIISRGYGGYANKTPTVVTPDTTPQQVGDEAKLIAMQTGSTVVVAKKRVQAAKYLIENFACDIIISDDGLQHYALERDIEIVVVDGDRCFGNEWCLPAGPLREPISRLNSVDYIIVNGTSTKSDVFTMQLVPQPVVSLIDNSVTRTLESFQGQHFHAIAGIGNPQRFFNVLSEAQLSFSAHAFADHHHYTFKDIAFAADEPVIMTTKDAVKCQAFCNYQHWVLPVVAEVDTEFLQQLWDDVVVLLQR